MCGAEESQGRSGAVRHLEVAPLDRAEAHIRGDDPAKTEDRSPKEFDHGKGVGGGLTLSVVFHHNEIHPRAEARGDGGRISNVNAGKSDLNRVRLAAGGVPD